jgi:small conductance mechanosensitive channel
MQERLADLRESGQTQETQALQKDVDDLEVAWNLAQERFDLAIQENTALKEKVAALEKKLRQDREAMNRLQAGPAAASQPAAEEGVPGPEEKPAASPTQPAEPAVPSPSGGPSPPAKTTSPGTGAPVAPPSEELRQAEQEAQEKAVAAEEAEQEAATLGERIAALRKTIESERELLETARKKRGNADQTQFTLAEMARKRSADGVPRSEVDALLEKVAQARERYRQARDDVARRVEQIDELQADLDELQAEYITVLQEAENKRLAAERARRDVEELKNPFALQNLLRWVNVHGTRVLFMVISIVVLLVLVRIVQGRIIRLITRRSHEETEEEREDRIRTLTSVFRKVMYFAVIVGGVLMILAELGINMVPLLGGAAAVSVAVGFGAQSLIKDYFNGFMILLENQYGINDVVRIGGVAGLVERVNLRATVLRDLEGTVHFIPHGQATMVSNLTHGWSRVVVDMPVAYKEDVDRVMEVIREIGRELREDPEFGFLMMGDLEMLGLDQFADSAVVVKFIIKTRPLQQWSVKRETLIRIKRKFDELGIEIPFPHRTVYHHYSPDAPSGDEPALPK